MRRVLVCSLFIITILIVSTTVFAAEINEEITAVSVNGNNNIESNEILSVIKTEVGETLNKEKLKKDMQRISDLGYFQHVEISFKNHQGGIKVIFKVVENPVIKRIKFEGNEVYKKPKLVGWLGINTGKILNVNQFDKGLKNIREKYQDNGYILAKITNVNIDESGILNIGINVGYLNKIILKGNEKTKDFVIMRELRDLEKGQVLNINDIKQSYQKIYKLNYFKEIKPELKRADNESNRVNLVINMTEKKTGTLNFGAGYSTKDAWLGFINVKEKNLLGKGQTIGFEWEFGGTDSYSLNFYEPWLFGNPTSFGFSIYDQTSDYEYNDEYEYTEKSRGGSISFGHALNEAWDGTVKYKIEDNDIEWEDDVPVSYEDESGSIRTLTLKADKDTTNHPFNPTQGSIDTLSVEYAGSFLGGDYDFTKYNFDFRRFYPGFKSGQAWALRLKAGFSEDDLPTSEQYKLGGSQNLRGYDSYTFYGDDMLLLNLEYRFPVADKFTGVVFGDAGNTWESSGDIDLGDLHHSLGLGVRMNTPIGQIRLDYGWNEDGEGMPHFSIGQTF